MTFGDILEVAAGICLAIAFNIWFGVPATLVVVAVLLVYFAQGFDSSLPKPRKPRLPSFLKRGTSE